MKQSFLPRKSTRWKRLNSNFEDPKSDLFIIIQTTAVGRTDGRTWFQLTCMRMTISLTFKLSWRRLPCKITSCLCKQRIGHKIAVNLHLMVLKQYNIVLLCIPFYQRLQKMEVKVGTAWQNSQTLLFLHQKRQKITWKEEVVLLLVLGVCFYLFPIGNHAMRPYLVEK